MKSPVETVSGGVRGMRRSTRAMLLAVLAVITPAGLVLVNIAAYVMANLAAFRVGITIGAVVSTVALNALTAVAGYRVVEARLAGNRWVGWIFQPKYLRSNAVCGAFILVLVATISGELTYRGLADPKKLPNLQTFLAGLLGLIVPLALAAAFGEQASPRARRRYRTRG